MQALPVITCCVQTRTEYIYREYSGELNRWKNFINSARLEALSHTTKPHMRPSINGGSFNKYCVRLEPELILTWW